MTPALFIPKILCFLIFDNRMSFRIAQISLVICFMVQPSKCLHQQSWDTSSHPLWKFPRSVHYEIYCLRWTCSPLAELSGEASSYFIHSMLPFRCPGIDVTVHVLLNRQISCKEKCTESTEHLFSCRLNCSFIFPGGRWSEINGNGANIKTFSLKLFSVLWR